MIDFTLSPETTNTQKMIHAVADSTMRPISREYDEREHEKERRLRDAKPPDDELLNRKRKHVSAVGIVAHAQVCAPAQPRMIGEHEGDVRDARIVECAEVTDIDQHDDEREHRGSERK